MWRALTDTERNGGLSVRAASWTRPEPTNAITVGNTIVLASRANAIRVSPEPLAYSELKAQSQTLAATLRLIFEVDKTHNLSEPDVSRPEGAESHCCFSLNWPEQLQ